jgi:hypothetical protein
MTGGGLEGEPSMEHGPLTYDGTEPTGERRINYCFSEYVDDPGAMATIEPDARADELQRDLETGRAVVRGREERDGREAIRLNYPEDPSSFSFSGSIWLDGTTLLPFLREGTDAIDGELTESYEFLDRSAKNLDLLVPPVPDGFTKVETLHDEDAGVAAGCEPYAH